MKYVKGKLKKSFVLMFLLSGNWPSKTEEHALLALLLREKIRTRKLHKMYFLPYFCRWLKAFVSALADSVLEVFICVLC